MSLKMGTNMSYSVYLTNQFLKPVLPLLSPDWNVFGCWDAQTNNNDIIALGTTVWDSINAEYLSQFPNLKCICHLGIGTDNIDKNYLQKNHIKLIAQPQAGVHDTSELAFTLMLTLSRKIIPNNQYIRDNHWTENKPRFLGNHLYKKQLGLVGLGQIGTTIAKFATAFGMNVGYTTRNKKENAYTYYQDINNLAADSDFLVICCSGGVDTYHLINKSVLLNLGPNGYLINVARGSVVDETALIEALQEGVIAGAGLDVFEQEPVVPIELRSLDNVVLSPHMGSSTKENLNQMFQLQADQLNDYHNHITQ